MLIATRAARSTLSVWFIVVLIAGCGGGGGGGDDGGGGGSGNSDGSDAVAYPPELVGLDTRPSNLTCTAKPRPREEAKVRITPAFPGLQFEKPVAMVQMPDDSEHGGRRWYLLEQTGRVWTFTAGDTVGNVTLAADLRDRVVQRGEGGLLNIAFHPAYFSNRQIFIYYTGSGAPLTAYLSRFTLAPDGVTIDTASEQHILIIDHPHISHLGGGLGFDHEGYLYLSLGDGSMFDDEFGNSQNTETLHGSLLRIDVDGAFPYTIPADNPFVAGGGRGEIYAMGFRNPWRWSIDPDTGNLWLADVGRGRWEEINLVVKGGNYGWIHREGAHCTFPEQGSCVESPEFIDPVVEYSHAEGCAVVGGHVYRGETLPDLAGRFIYGDFCSGRIWAVGYDANGEAQPRLLNESGLSISGFARSNEGELYLLDYAGGEVYRMAAPDTAPPTADPFPQRLSETGCTEPGNPWLPADGLIAYTVNAPFWSDGADKARWLALPDGKSVTIDKQGNLVLPVGSVVVKQFRRNNRLLETRLLMRHEDGKWAGYSYEWNNEQSDATLVRGGKIAAIDGQEWIYPSSAECLRCHVSASKFTLGLETAQMNGNHTYTETGRTANQLITLDHIGIFDKPLGGGPDDFARLATPADETLGLDERARAYLHSNCAQCHQPGGPTGRSMDLRFDTPLQGMNICERMPEGSNLGDPELRLLQPGEPERSLLLLRMSRRDLYRMPPLASSEPDSEGVRLIEQWIASINHCGE